MALEAGILERRLDVRGLVDRQFIPDRHRARADRSAVTTAECGTGLGRITPEACPLRTPMPRQTSDPSSPDRDGKGTGLG